MPTKLKAGAAMPQMKLAKVGGGTAEIGGRRDKWQVVVVYRGRHCPICKRYLTALNGLAEGFGAINTDVLAVSGDPKDKAEADKQELGLGFDVAYDLSQDQMRTLGLYISNPRSPQETDRPFSEPGVFIVNPAGQAQVIDVSNAPFARPDLNGILNGLKFVQEKNYPPRGTAD
jgi:peroxiredoxin